MVATHDSKRHGSESRQNSCQIPPPENIENVSASRRCLWVQTTVSTVWSAASSSEPELQAVEKRLSDALPIHQSHQKWLKTFFYLSEGFTKASYRTLNKRWHRPISKLITKPSYSTSRATSIDSDYCRLPTASVLSNKADKSCSNY